KRRAFITLLGGATAWPLAARGQQRERMRQIGVLMGWPESDPEARLERAAFVQELQKLGWLHGRNLRIDTLGEPRRSGVDASIREGTRRVTARPHSFAQHSSHCRAAARNSYHSRHFRDRC